jgi:hypothetical protein
MTDSTRSDAALGVIALVFALVIARVFTSVSTSDLRAETAERVMVLLNPALVEVRSR